MRYEVRYFKSGDVLPTKAARYSIEDNARMFLKTILEGNDKFSRLKVDNKGFTCLYSCWAILEWDELVENKWGLFSL